MLPIWVFLLAFSAYYAVKARKSMDNITRFLNTTTIILILFSGINIGANLFKQSYNTPAATHTTTVNAEHLSLGYRPDIYYIIPDGYANEHVLENIYEDSDQDFLDFLSEKGFYIATESRANYGHTTLSLASSISMNYLQDIAEKFGPQSKDPTEPWRLIRSGEAIQFLKDSGYKFILVRSGWGPTNYNQNADIAIRCGEYNEFMKVLIHSTMMILLEGKIWFPDWTRNMTINQFNELGKVASLEGPKFVLTHFPLPHPPFVFGAEGEPVNPDDLTLGSNIWIPRSRYYGQLRFMSFKLRKVITEILEKSEKEPVIIIQSDHGPASLENWNNPSDEFITERMMILNAYYLPAGDTARLYKDITPVNTFRLIFDTYFGADYQMLNDSSYYSPLELPYDLTEVTGIISKTLLEFSSIDSLSISGEN